MKKYILIILLLVIGLIGYSQKPIENDLEVHGNYYKLYNNINTHTLSIAKVDTAELTIDGVLFINPDISTVINNNVFIEDTLVIGATDSIYKLYVSNDTLYFNNYIKYLSDMYQSVYDTDANNVVDNADSLGSHSLDYFVDTLNNQNIYGEKDLKDSVRIDKLSANYIPRTTNTKALTNSQIQDDGDGIGINVAPETDVLVKIKGKDALGLSTIFQIDDGDDATKLKVLSDGATTFYDEDNTQYVNFQKTGRVLIGLNEAGAFPYPTAFGINFNGANLGVSSKTYFGVTGNNIAHGRLFEIGLDAGIGRICNIGGTAQNTMTQTNINSVQFEVRERVGRTIFYGHDYIGMGNKYITTGIGYNETNSEYNVFTSLNIQQNINATNVTGGIKVTPLSTYSVTDNTAISLNSKSIYVNLPNTITYYNNNVSFPWTLNGGFFDIKAISNINRAGYFNAENADENIALETANGKVIIGDNLIINGNLEKNHVTFTSDETIDTEKISYIYIDANGSNVTVTLPAATAVPNREYKVKCIDATNTATLNGGGTNIDAAATYVFSLNEAITVYSDGTQWRIF